MKSLLQAILGALALLGSVAVATYFLVPECRAWVRNSREGMVRGGKRGFVGRVHVDADGNERKYVVFVPYSRSPGKQYPLILYLNGLGKRGNDGFSQLTDGLAPSLWETKATFPFIALFPQCPFDTTWVVDDQLVIRTMRLLDETIASYNVDPDRVFVTGLSSGGSGVWRFAELFPDRFAGIIPVSFPACASDVQERLLEHQVPVWSFHVHNDAGVVDGGRSTYRRFVERGGSPRFTEVNGLSARNTHNSWDFAFRNVALHEWVWRRNRPRNQSESGRFLPLIMTAKDLNRWKASGSTWTVDSNGILSCRNTDRRRSSLLYENQYKNYELHLDFEMTGGDCRLLFYSGNQNNNGLLLHITHPERGSGGLVDLKDGGWLQAANAVAQRAVVHDGWNDLRIQVSGDRMDVEVNGWPLHCLKDECVSGLNGQFALVPSSNEDTPTRWRYIRLRERK